MIKKKGYMLFAMLIFLASPAATWAQKAPASAKPMVLKASIQTPANMPFAKILYWWLDEVEKRSGGRKIGRASCRERV